MVAKRVFLLFVILGAGILGKAQCHLSFYGTVTDQDTRGKLGGATIRISETGKTVLSADDGSFRIAGLCPGNYNIVVTHVGCQPLHLHIHLKDDLRKEILLPHAANELSEITIVARLGGNSSGFLDELKGREFNATLGKSLGESLKNINGVNAIQTGSNIYKPVIHGLHSSRVLILNNGIRQEGQQWGSEHAPEVDPFIANRISVVKGASTLRYGHDAIGGVVLVEPRLLRNKPGWGGEFQTGFFSNNRQAVLSGAIDANSKKIPEFAWRLQGTLKKGGNSKTAGYWLDNSGLEEYNFSVSAGWKKENRGYEIFYSQFNTKLGIFSGSHIGNVTDLENAVNSKEPPDYIRNVPFTYKIDRPFQQVQHHLAKGKFFQNTGEYGRLNLTLAFQQNNRKEYDSRRFESSSDLPQLLLELTTVSADLVWDHFPSGPVRGTVGATASYQYNSYERRLFIPNYETINAGLFWIEKFNWKKWVLEGGWRYDFRKMYNVLTNNNVEFPEQKFGNLSANAGVVRPLNEHLQLRANFSTTWRAPQVNELYSDGLHHGAARLEKGYAGLKPERANTIIAGGEFDNRRLLIDVSFYYKSVKDFIFLKPIYPPQLTIRGAFPSFAFDQTNAMISGIDITAGYAINFHLSWKGKGSFLRAKDRTAGDWLIQMPADRITNEFEFVFSDRKKWKEPYLKVSMENVMKQTRVPASGNIEIKQTDGTVVMASDYAPPPAAYTLIKLEAGVTLHGGKNPLSLIAGADNLLNTAYRDYLNAFRYFSDDKGRNIWVRLNYSF